VDARRSRFVQLLVQGVVQGFHCTLNGHDSMFACFYVPDFPVQASLLAELSLAELTLAELILDEPALAEPAEARIALSQTPLAILDGPANLPRVFATNAAARGRGIQTGMTKLQVETYGGIELRKRSLEAEDYAQKVLVTLAGKFSPIVESTCDGAVILDLAGTERILGTWKTAIKNMSASALAAGLQIRVAIAANPDTAFHAARGFSLNTIIPAGEESHRLASLPVDLLPISAEMLDVLEAWGIRTFESLASLPTIAVVERLGQEGLHLQKLAQGAVNRVLLPVERDRQFIESYEFEEPVETLESLQFILNRLLQQLCEKLMEHSRAAQELKLTVKLEVRQIEQTQNGRKGEQYQHRWKLPIPTQDKNLLFGLVRLHLEQTTFSAPIRLLAVEAIPVKPRPAQGNLFAPPSPEAEKLAITLERISGTVGRTDEQAIACVGSPRLVDSHKPGSFAVEPFSGEISPPEQLPEIAMVIASVSTCEARNRFAALRIFRPVISATVELDGEKPYMVELWKRRRRVLAASGPWLSSGDWWSASFWIREDWDVVLQLSAGTGLYRIYRDRLRQQWFVEGIFD
jgi:protein ImuB